MLSFFPCLFFYSSWKTTCRPTDRVLRESIAHTRTAVGYVPALSLPVSITQTPTRPDTGNQEVMSWLHFLFSFSPFSNHRIRQLFVVIQGTRMKILITEQGFLFLLCLNYCAQPICVGPSTQKMAAVSSLLCYFFFRKTDTPLRPEWLVKFILKRLSFRYEENKVVLLCLVMFLSDVFSLPSPPSPPLVLRVALKNNKMEE